ncbi:Kinase D-interacting substrate of 220 kDa [Geodia barretti]|nr:Kinase D-interacting substrate of 220 kDa [Geodia barretti]
MPPEALRPQPRYSDKIDTFSVGVLLLQIVTREFPAPTAASVAREDPNSPTEESYVPVSEINRRKADIDKVQISHGFLSVIRDCLKDKSKDRPIAAQLCQRLGQLKSTAVYSWSRSAVLLEGRTELHDAAERGDVEAVQRLLSTSVNINFRTEDEGHSALLLASARGHVEVVRLLLKAGAAVFIPDKESRSPLYWASFYGHRAVVELLLKNGADITICNENGSSPLYVASEYGHTEVVDILVKAGADVNQACTKEPCSVPLGIAAAKGHTETVHRLLVLGADINHQNKNGTTALLSAGLNGRSEVVKLLLVAGARDIRNKFGNTALSTARDNDVVQYLLQHQPK